MSGQDKSLIEPLSRDQTFGLWNPTGVISLLL